MFCFAWLKRTRLGGTIDSRVLWPIWAPAFRITFLKAQWETMAAAGFTTVEVWTRSGLVTFYIFAVMRLKTRRVEIAGITAHPDSVWMTQVGRNLTDFVDGFLRNSSYLILDRDTKHLPLR